MLMGILQLPTQSSHALRYTPESRDKRRALTRLATGPVVRVMLRCREAFWEDIRDGKFRDAAFLHARDASFPTFWTPLPVRAPVLAAWCAGPNATRLSGLDESQIVARALDSVTMLLGNRAR